MLSAVDDWFLSIVKEEIENTTKKPKYYNIW